MSVASMSLRLVEVIPLQLASLRYEDQLRSEQWKTRPLRVESRPHAHISPDPYQAVQLGAVINTTTGPQKQLLLLKVFKSHHQFGKKLERRRITLLELLGL